MARIRTIKPEFPQSESMGRVSREARLLYVELWTICDDAGRARGNSRMLASLLFPYDDDAPTLIDGWMSELEREHCVRRYEIGGNHYVQVVKWLQHQKIDKPTASRIPEFAEASRALAKPREASSQDLGPRKGSRTKDQGEDLVETRIASRHAPSLAAPSSSQSQSPSKTSPPPTGTRWPPDAIVPEDWFEPAESARALATLAPIDLRTEATRFANYWASKSGRDATKLDWRKTWINWVLNARSNANGSPTRQSGKSQHPFGVFGACLEKERAGDGAPTLEHEAGEGGCFEDPGAPQRDLRVPARPA